MSLNIPLIFPLLLILTFSKQSFGHGDLHERIIKVSQEIESHSDSAYLYFKRGKLYFYHEDYNEALADLQKAKSLKYIDHYCDLFLAKTYLNLNKPDYAIEITENILVEDSVNVHAYKTKANAHLVKKDYEKAANAFQKILIYSKRTFPENYLDLSSAWEKLNTKKGNTKAIASMQDGILEFGPLIILQQKLKSLYVQDDDFENAFNIQKEIVARSQRKEFALFEAAKMLEKEGRKAESLAYANLALENIKILPRRFLNSNAIRTLKNEIHILKLKLSN